MSDQVPRGHRAAAGPDAGSDRAPDCCGGERTEPVGHRPPGSRAGRFGDIGNPPYSEGAWLFVRWGLTVVARAEVAGRTSMRTRSRRLRDADQLLTSADKRLARVLIRLAHSGKAHRVLPAINQQTLADL